MSSEPARFVYCPPDVPLQLVHVDDHVIVADKPAGLLSVPGRGEDRADCLITRLRARFPDVRLVHRLDLDTSGIILFARSHAAQAALGRQFETRTTAKIYVARIHGIPGQVAGRIDLPLNVDWPNRPRHRVDHQAGKPAQTDWRLLAAGRDEARVELCPLTGRSHQLRVHMQALGHPILGDPLYATGAARAYPRLMLHAARLGFDHPADGRRVEFAAAVPF